MKPEPPSAPVGGDIAGWKMSYPESCPNCGMLWKLMLPSSNLYPHYTGACRAYGSGAASSPRQTCNSTTTVGSYVHSCGLERGHLGDCTSGKVSWIKPSPRQGDAPGFRDMLCDVMSAVKCRADKSISKAQFDSQIKKADELLNATIAAPSISPSEAQLGTCCYRFHAKFGPHEKVDVCEHWKPLSTSSQTPPTQDEEFPKIGVLNFQTPEDAKNAKALFKKMQAEIDELRAAQTPPSETGQECEKWAARLLDGLPSDFFKLSKKSVHTYLTNELREFRAALRSSGPDILAKLQEPGAVWSNILTGRLPKPAIIEYLESRVAELEGRSSGMGTSPHKLREHAEELIEILDRDGMLVTVVEKYLREFESRKCCALTSGMAQEPTK